MEKDSAVMQNTNYKLLDLMKFICAFLVIGIHTRPLQSVSDVADKLFYYDISNYAVPFFYAWIFHKWFDDDDKRENLVSWNYAWNNE